MDIRYASDLLDEVVARELLRRDAAGDGAWLREFHILTDPFYQLDSEAAREAAFERVHALYFRKLGFAAPLERVLPEFPELAREKTALIVERAGGAQQEEADLLVGADPAHRGTVRLRIQSSRFENAVALDAFLRHELWHVADMLRPKFGYRPAARLADRPAEENLIRSRLHLLWNLSVAGAIERIGRPGAASREAWSRAAQRVYAFLPAVQLAGVVRAFWDAKGMTYGTLLECARRPDVLLAHAGIATEAREEAMAPGSPCPLCGFPTHDWAPSPEGLPEVVAAGIRADFPAWSPSDGVCRQCLGAYGAHSPSMNYSQSGAAL